MRAFFICSLVIAISLGAASASFATWPAAGDTLAPATTVRPAAGWPYAEDTLALALLDSLQVGKIDLEIAADSEEAGRQLWDLLENSELSKRCSQLRVPSGTSVWPVFRSRLVAVARSNGFESASLERVLNVIEQHEPHLTTKGQLIPFAALQAHRAGEVAWVILCRWESGYRPPEHGVTYSTKVGHIRAWAFLAQSSQQVGYTTCR